MRQKGSPEIIGVSRAITELKDEIARVARSDAKVLITGESGTGKEVVARAINAQSPRAHQPFVPVNCAGIPEALLESELFGHVKGSFTGAYRDKPGKLEMSENGTVFLDEIGEMTLRMQGLLLRFLETGEIQKVGAERPASVRNVRVITATNRNLRDLIQQGLFREDLFYRINVIHIVVPPLRERREVIQIDDLSPEIRTPGQFHMRPRRERRKTVADELFRKLREDGESFWTAVYPLYMNREITRGNVRDLIHKGLEEARGNYKIVLRLFNMEPGDYKRFLNFLRKHDCQLPFKEYREYR
jgi:sigma54-dependent transcription regulator